MQTNYYVLFLLLLGFAVQAQPAWKIHIIDNLSNGADGVKLADINHDGLMDIATGWEEGGFTKLYLNPGFQKVNDKWPSVVVGKTPDVEDAVFVELNNDGLLHIVSCAENQTKKIIVHWNLKNDALSPGNWKQEILPASYGMMMWMYAEPLNIDNKNGVDLIAAGKNMNAAIGWFEAPTNAKNLNDWKWHEISPVGWVMSIVHKDMDSDGDTDIVITDRRGEFQGCRWLENPGTGESQKENWKNHFIGAQNLEVMFMSMADFNGDNIEEAIVCEQTNQTIRIFQRKDKQGLDWSEKVVLIPQLTGAAKSVEAGDVNNDGIIDLVLSTETLGNERYGLIWLDGNHLSDTKESDWQMISGWHNAKYDKVELIDLDNDGDLDVLTCEENFGEKSEGLGVIWYENPIKNSF